MAREVEPPQLGGYEEQRAATLAGYLELRVAAHPGVLEWRKLAWGTTRPASSEGAYAIVENTEIKDVLSGSWNVENKETGPSAYLEFFTREPGQGERIPYYPNSDLQRLHDLSKNLQADLFPEWTEAEAAWIIVTGEVREVPRCLVGKIDGFSNPYLTYATIKLEVEPWITAETVTRAYQYLQRLVLGRRPRAFSERNMTMARFVMQRLRDLVTDASEGEEREGMSWRVAMRSWNQTHPQWSYRDERQFYQDVHRVIRAVARPYDNTAGSTSEDAEGSTSGDFATYPVISIPEGDDPTTPEDLRQPVA